MNDFHWFAIHIDNGQINRAMLVLRDKTEAVARKIMIKAGVTVPSYTGKSFWTWVQNYIFDACRQKKESTHVQSQQNTIRSLSRLC